MCNGNGMRPVLRRPEHKMQLVPYLTNHGRAGEIAAEALQGAEEEKSEPATPNQTDDETTDEANDTAGSEEISNPSEDSQSINSEESDSSSPDEVVYIGRNQLMLHSISEESEEPPVRIRSGCNYILDFGFGQNELGKKGNEKIKKHYEGKMDRRRLAAFSPAFLALAENCKMLNENSKRLI